MSNNTTEGELKGAICLLLIALVVVITHVVAFDEKVSWWEFDEAIALCGDRKLLAIELDTDSADVFCRDGSSYPSVVFKPKPSDSEEGT